MKAYRNSRMVHSLQDGHPGENGYMESHTVRADSRHHTGDTRLPTGDTRLQPGNSNGRHMTTGRKPEKKFLREVQDELEDQRTEWQFEIERMMSKNPMPRETPANAQPEGRNSYIDTSSGTPIFTAYVDVSEFSPKHISVNLDKITNKIIVKAEQRSGMGTVTKTFTEKVNLPRFADDSRLVSRLSKRGVLKLEVPVLYYFPQEHSPSGGKQAKSFVYQVKAGQDGSERLEILVNTSSECGADDLRVEVTDEGKLVILARGAAKGARAKLLKQYTLPELADVQNITSRLGKDGRLQVNVPLFRKRMSSSEQN